MEGINFNKEIADTKAKIYTFTESANAHLPLYISLSLLHARDALNDYVYELQKLNEYLKEGTEK